VRLIKTELTDAMKNFASLLGVAAIAAVVFSCSDPGALGPDAAISHSTPLNGLVISNSHTLAASAALSVRASTNVAIEGGVVYASLAPGTLPEALEIQIENRTSNLPGQIVAAVDGGFDPVPVRGSEGDTLALTARMVSGTGTPVLVKVPARRPPSVVRTSPGKGRTDVALNVIVGVVFSEPIDRATVNASTIRLLRDGRQVNGDVLLQANSWNAEFVPAAALDPGSRYELIVTTQVRDTDGDALESSYNIPFITTTTPCGLAGGQPECVSGIEGNRVISGRVTERTESGSRPVPNAMISIWVQPNDDNGYSLSSVQTNADGSYSITSLPAARVQLHAEVDGLDQPCGVVVWPTLPSVSAKIELVASDRLATQPGASLWGFIYEWVLGTGAKVPVSGARVVVESSEGIVAATATSDVNGNFALCSLPDFPQQTIAFTKSGYNTNKGKFMLGPGLYSSTIPMMRVIPGP